MRIGLFGGSFDPVHMGHENLVRALIKKLSLDKVFVMPAFVSPFKVKTPPKASPEDRLAMLRLAFEGDEKVTVLTDEIDRQEVSYTIDTVRRLVKKFPQDKFFLLLTEEAISTFPLWKEFKEIQLLAQVVFVGSAEIPWIPISSTEIREDLEKRKKFLSAKVLDYIGRHQLYSL